MITTDLGSVTAYAEAVAQGYTGTKEEFGKLLANYTQTAEKVAEDKAAAEQAMESAKESADRASASEQNAKASEDAVLRKLAEAKTEVDASVEAGKKSKTDLNKSIADSAKAKTALDESIKSANGSKSALDKTVEQANVLDASLSSNIVDGTQLNKGITASGTKAVSDINSASAKALEDINTTGTAKLDAVNKAAEAIVADREQITKNKTDIDLLKEDKVNKTEFVIKTQTVFANIADIRAYLGITTDDIVGIQVDYKNKTFKRLAGAVNLSKGSDFDKFTMFGGRKRCNVADDGSIVAWYGDADYKEDGSMGQVMVYQPKFYYLVCPVEYEPIDTGIGYHVRKANYYVSEKPRTGFRLHPAFYDASGNEIDYFLTSAYEGSIYDASASAYLLNDEQVITFDEDKFSSIAGARPASGSLQNLTRQNVEAMAQNRGTNWHCDLIKQVSAEQMLMIIEMGMMNLQTAIAKGVVSVPLATGSDTTSSYAAATGSTASLGNGTGRAEKTTTYEGGVAKEYTVDGKTSVCWRGKENFWGNIWKSVYGINIWGNGKMGGGQPYICTDFSFAESKNSGNYEGAGFTVTPKEGYISAMGYSTACDWLFIASECLGNSSLPVGDYTYITVNLKGYNIALVGGRWSIGGYAGGFSWSLDSSTGSASRLVGGRLVYIPTRDSATYAATIEAWKQKMEA